VCNGKSVTPAVSGLSQSIKFLNSSQFRFWIRYNYLGYGQNMTGETALGDNTGQEIS
jgi:hypothetical protein